MARRDFAKFLVLTSGAFVAGQAGSRPRASCAERRPEPGADADRIAWRRFPVGGATMFTYPGEHDPCLLIRLRDGKLRRLQPEVHAPVVRRDPASSTRASCAVRVTRASSSSRPGATSPARRPVRSRVIELEVDGDDVYAIGVEGGDDVSRASRRQLTRAQRLTVVYGMLCFVLILVVLQLWLLTATMNAWLGGDGGWSGRLSPRAPAVCGSTSACSGISFAD